MGYRIEYEPVTVADRTADRSWLRISTLTGAFLIAFTVLVNICWPRGQKVLQELLWPGNKETTLQAVECFVTELRYGEPIGDAVESFCREILKDANNSG